MYQEQESIVAKSANTLIPPATLLVGPLQETTDYAVRFIQNTLCLHGGCKTCKTCSGIAQQNHYQLLWIAPEQRYTLEIIEPIMSTIQLFLEDNCHFFFVLSHADRLSAACANSLLKIVEEPPAGYHFIFLAQRSEEILPTIRSRCIITQLDGNDHSFENNPLFSFFTLISNDNFANFLKTVEQSKITEQECIQLLDTLFVYWSNLYKKNSNTPKSQQAYAIIEILKKYSDIPPMTGSAKLFLKNLYLAIYHIIHKKIA